MVGETNAAIEGALAAGATDILVNDCTGTCTTCCRRTCTGRRGSCRARRPGRWSPGAQPAADGSPAFDVALFVGYHARAGHGRGTIAHTYSGRPDRDPPGRPADRRVRAQRPGPRRAGASRSGWSPATTPWPRRSRPGCRGPSGSWSRTADGTHSAISVHPEVARERIRAARGGGGPARGRSASLPPLEVEPPVVIEVDYAARRRRRPRRDRARRRADRRPDGPLRQRRPGARLPRLPRHQPAGGGRRLMATTQRG